MAKNAEKKKTAKNIAETELDTDDLLRFGRRFILESEDSFAAEYIRYAEKEADRIAKESSELDRKKAREIALYSGSNKSKLEVEVNTVNTYFRILSDHVSAHMHEYLLQKQGRVERWCESEVPWTSGFSKGRQFQYDYFKNDFQIENGALVPNEGLVFRNRYHYPARDPNRLAKALEKEFHDRHDRSLFLQKEEQNVKNIRSDMNSAKKKDDEIGDAKAGLILVFVMVVIAGLATARGLGLPVDLTPAATACTGFFEKMWNTLPVVLNFIVCALLAIPLWLLVIVMMLTNTVGTILFEIAALGAVWRIACLVVLWGAVLVASLMLGVHRIFEKSPLPAAQAAYDAAQAALEEKKAEYERMEQEFRNSDSYKKAQKQDRAETERDKEKQAANEAFAERWQRAWFEAVQQNAQRLQRSGSSTRRL